MGRKENSPSEQTLLFHPWKDFVGKIMTTKKGQTF